MTPTVEYVIAQVKAGSYTAMDLKDFSMMARVVHFWLPSTIWRAKSPPTC